MKNEKDSKKILIAAGGTGGHIFPAIVMGRNFEKEGAQVQWLCGARQLEQEIYKAQGVSPFTLSIEGSPLGTSSIKKNFGRCLSLIKSFFETFSFIKNFKPDEIFLFGGYISFAPLIVAKLKKIPVTLHEQNAIAGKVTRFALKLGAKIITGWPECEGLEKKDFEFVGIPVRKPVRLEREDALKTLGLDLEAGAKIICISGGSLGSGPLNSLLTKTAELCRDFEFVFISHEKKDSGNVHFILPQWNMNPFYSIADVLVCRAGGSTLAEVLSWGIPAVSIPWPEAADNHQTKNAAEFVKLSRNKSRAFDENDTPENLARVIGDLILKK